MPAVATVTTMTAVPTMADLNDFRRIARLRDSPLDLRGTRHCAG